MTERRFLNLFINNFIKKVSPSASIALDGKVLWHENKLQQQRMSSPRECGSQKYFLICYNKKYAADVKSTGSEFTWPFFTYIVHKFLPSVLCYCVCCPLLQRGVPLTFASRKCYSDTKFLYLNKQNQATTVIKP